MRTEAMQANVGEDMIIRGVNGVELLDAQEVYNEKVKQESKSVGISASLGSTITNFISSADEKSQNNGKYEFVYIGKTYPECNLEKTCKNENIETSDVVFDKLAKALKNVK